MSGWYTPSEAYRLASKHIQGTTEPDTMIIEDTAASAEHRLSSSEIGEYGALASLLDYDPVQYTKTGYRYTLRENGLDSNEREVIPMDGKTGIVGRDRYTVLNELHRLRNGKATGRRKRLAASAGVGSLLVVAATGYMLVSDVISIVRLSKRQLNADPQRIAFLVGSLAARSICILGGCVTVIWCRQARRASHYAKPVLLIALLCFMLHLTLGSINVLLVLLWRSSSVMGRSVRNRCFWGIDLLWQVGNSGNLCLPPEGSETTGEQVPWIVASCVRILITLFAGTTWLYLLRLFNRSIAVSNPIDPSIAPSEDVQTLLEKHAVNIVHLDDTSIVARTSYDPSQGIREYLPPMPERRSLLRNEDEEELESLRKREQSWSGTLWSAVSWFFGTSKYEGVKERPESTYRNSIAWEHVTPENPPNTWTPLNEKPMDEDVQSNSWNPLSIVGRWLWGPNTAQQDIRPSAPAESKAYDPAPTKRHPASISKQAASQSLGSLQYLPKMPAKVQHSGPLVASSKALKPLPQPPVATSAFTEHLDCAPASAPVIYHGWPIANTNQHVEYDPKESFNIKDEKDQGGAMANGTHQRMPSGNIVYVRMSDGRLVRRLSTIFSEQDHLSRDASLASNPGNLVGSERLLKPAVRSALPGEWRGSE